MISSTDGGVTLPPVGCIAGTACPPGAPSNTVPSAEAFTFFSLNATGTIAECRPASANPPNACTGRVPIVDVNSTQVGCTMSNSCPSGFFQLYGISPPPNPAAMLTSCLQSAPNCTNLPDTPVPVYSSTLGAGSATLAGCKATAASCPAAFPVMQLSATSNSVVSPSIQACFGGFTGNANCTGTHPIPVCSWNNPVTTGCSGAQVQGCLASGSNRCFLSGSQGNIVTAYPFIVAKVDTTTTPNAVSPLYACYQQPPATGPTPTCPQATAGLTSLITYKSQPPVAPGGCVLFDTLSVGSCTNWWKVIYNGNTNVDASCVFFGVSA